MHLPNEVRMVYISGIDRHWLSHRAWNPYNPAVNKHGNGMAMEHPPFLDDWFSQTFKKKGFPASRINMMKTIAVPICSKMFQCSRLRPGTLLDKLKSLINAPSESCCWLLAEWLGSPRKARVHTIPISLCLIDMKVWTWLRVFGLYRLMRPNSIIRDECHGASLSLIRGRDRTNTSNWLERELLRPQRTQSWVSMQVGL